MSAMNDTKDIAMDLRTLAEFLPQSQHEDERRVPALSSVLRGLKPLPRAALFLGVADDQLPVLLNLVDPVPGPVLVAGDSGSGKTRLLQTMAEAVAQTHDPDDVRFAIITEQVMEWEAFSQSLSCEAILSFQEPITANYVASLVSWAHSNKHSEQYVLLLIDGLEGLNADVSLHQSLRWLLLRGPSRRIWPIVTLKATRASAMNQWLPSFRTRLCGHIGADRDVTPLAGNSDAAFDRLQAGVQFALREGAAWLPFSLPAAG